MSLPGLILPPGLVASGGGGVAVGYQYLGTTWVRGANGAGFPRLSTGPVSFGTPDPSRVLVAAVSYGVNASPYQAVSTIHIGPYNLTPIAQNGAAVTAAQSNTMFAVVADAALTDGTVGHSGGYTLITEVFISLYALYGYSATPFDIKSGAATNASGAGLSLNIPANGIALAVTSSSRDSTTLWTENYVGPSLNYDNTNTGVRRPRISRAGSGLFAGAIAGYGISITPTSSPTSSRSVSAVSFQRAA